MGYAMVPAYRRRYVRAMADEAKPRQRTFKISRRRQITLPEEVLRRAKLNVGDRLRVEHTSSGRIVLIADPHPLDRFIGSMPGLYEPGDLEELRSEWDR
jgi:bifunctional DNA-binding transcriptional regulator/antitoxin component of YhaV-PrlF toxin-antitoxin module